MKSMEEIDINTTEWRAPEYTHKKKSADFFWTIGLVAIVACIIAIWLHNYLFAIFIFISGGCLILFTLREPQEMAFSIGNEGISMGKDKYAWAKIKGFAIKKGNGSNKLMIVTSKYFLPIYTIPLPQNITEEVRSSLLKVVPSVEIEESRSMLFMEKLGF